MAERWVCLDCDCRFAAMDEPQKANEELGEDLGLRCPSCGNDTTNRMMTTSLITELQKADFNHEVVFVVADALDLHRNGEPDIAVVHGRLGLDPQKLPTFYQNWPEATGLSFVERHPPYLPENVYLCLREGSAGLLSLSGFIRLCCLVSRHLNPPHPPA